ncbi:TolC family outer membrane protein [Caenimonas sp. SL110]|uniref:TolC family outer membrane protein n=1 Tax=Caenimonas sp. SL110 TaxID=1450524 RepID=UPI00069D5CBF|nr:TolC family outer membrane protein [Caenimonas sp. SL110]
MMRKTIWRAMAAAGLFGSTAALLPAAIAQPVQAPVALASTAAPFTLKEAAQLAVLKNPEVLARWHAIKAAEAEREAARGGLLPRVDLNATAGPERRTGATTGDYSRNWTSLSLTQLLYDGFTRQEIDRLDHNVKVRLFEFFDISEATALETARAYFDVLRYRALVKLAEDNFVEHRAVFGQTDKRVQAKVARAVDLEQISGRLALAEANLLIETANLHDTTARFQRIVGRLPSQVMAAPPVLNRDLPPDAVSAVQRAQVQHPALLASIESVRAADAALQSRKGAYQPRLDFRLKRDQGNNQLGPVGNVGTTTAEVVMTWNLFNGFADRSRERQFVEQVNIAKDIRDKTCRDLRQTLLIAFNDVQKLKEQLGYLATHETSVGKALIAYRQQFDIGQRSLLDLLDTENELFQARRAVAIAQQDLNLAHARVHASVGSLLRALELTTIDTGGQETVANWRMEGDGAQQCPVEAVTVYTVDKSALTTRAMQQTRAVAVPQAVMPAVPGAIAQSAPAAPAAPVVTPNAPQVPQGTVGKALESWRSAWSSRDIPGYLQMYSPAFQPAGGETFKAWQARRQAVIGRSSGVTVEISNVVTTLENGGERATTVFAQNYRSASYQDRTQKTLRWEKAGGNWVIVSETSAPLK